MNDTIRRHLSGKRIEERPADDEVVLGFWNKALKGYADARNASASVEARFLRAYDAGRLAALAMVRAAGYRARGGEGHHFVTFDVAASLAVETELRTAPREVDELRQLRHTVEYEAWDELDIEAVRRAVRLAEQVINLGAKQLRDTRPGLGKRLKMVKPQGT